jgi:hypothetical protein
MVTEIEMEAEAEVAVAVTTRMMEIVEIVKKVAEIVQTGR